MELDKEVIEKTKISAGAHKSLKQGACIMELVSHLANEPWSDAPECTCPVLAAYARRYNDRVDDEHREKLKTLIPKLIGTRDKNLEKARYQHLALKAVTVFLPLLTEALDMPDVTATLLGFTAKDFAEARDYIRSQKENIRAAMKKKAAAAYAAAAADDAADAAAYAAAAAAYAAAAAEDAADAAAYAAAAAAYAAADAGKKFWTDLKLKIWAEGFKALAEACDIGAKK